VAFDRDANLRIVAQEVSGLGERWASVSAISPVEIEIGVADVPQEESLMSGSALFAGGGGVLTGRAWCVGERRGRWRIV